MKGSVQNALSILRSITVCIAILCSVSSRADSWLPPSEFDSLSENRKFVAHVIPGKTLKPQMIVSAVDTSKTNKLWRIELCNDVSPSKLWISDNGESVVTADNWGGGGYGDDVIAIYNKHGLLAKYSLEQIAPPPKPQKNDLASYSDWQAYRNKFSHSTSSRHWRQNSIEFFYQETDQLLFCLWLDWDNRWVVWRTTDGKMIKLTADQTQKLNVEGRKRAHKDVKANQSVGAALNFLGRLRFKEDRTLIETWLSDTNFSTGSRQSYSSGKPNMDFAFTASSRKRETADKILSRWDNGDQSEGDFRIHDRYQFLGILKCAVSFSVPPKKKNGTIRLYIIPEAISLNEWVHARPTQYSIGNFNDSNPENFERSDGSGGRKSSVVNFIIYGITPGQYRLKAVWDKAAPFAQENEIVYRAQKGDYESTTSPVISIRKGATTDGVRIECDKLVK